MGRFAWTRILEPDRARYRYRTGSWGKGIKVRYAIPKGRTNRWRWGSDFEGGYEGYRVGPDGKTDREDDVVASTMRHEGRYHWTVSTGPLVEREGIARSHTAAKRAAERAAGAMEKDIFAEMSALLGERNGGQRNVKHNAAVFLDFLSASQKRKLDGIFPLDAEWTVAPTYEDFPELPLWLTGDSSFWQAVMAERIKRGKGGRRNLELLTVKPGKILPVSNPAFNIREANKRKGRRNRWQLAIDYWPPSEDNPPMYHWLVKKGAITAPRVGDNREEFAEGFAFSRAAARRAAKRAVDALERGEGPLPVQYELRPGKPGRRNLELLTTKPGKILPVSNPAFNIREATKQMILLEEHLSVPAKRCPDCIGKHLLAIEALADEAACLDKRQELGRLPGELGALSRKAQGDLLSGADPYRVAQDIRAVRKKLLKRVFPYKKP
jgi:hypothetical protein